MCHAEHAGPQVFICIRSGIGLYEKESKPFMKKVYISKTIRLNHTLPLYSVSGTQGEAKKSTQAQKLKSSMIYERNS